MPVIYVQRSFHSVLVKKFEEKKKHKSSPNEKSSEKSLKCNHCDKEFTRRVSLKRHMKTHFKTQTDSYECEKCKKRFFRQELKNSQENSRKKEFSMYILQ